jgi:hypothetical protein
MHRRKEYIIQSASKDTDNATWPTTFVSKSIYDLQLLSALRNPFVMPSIWICDRSRVHIFFDQITGSDR